MNRRSFLLGLLSTTAAPAISGAVSVEKLVYDKATRTIIRIGIPTPTWRLMHEVDSLKEWGEMVEMLVKENEFYKKNIIPFQSSDDYEYDDD